MITELHSTIGRVSLDLIDRRSDLETQLSLASDLLRDTVRVLDGRTDMEVLISRSDLQSKLARVDELAGDEFGRPIVYSPGGVSGPARHCDLTFDRELVFQPGTLSLARLASESQEKTELESPEITETKEDTPEEVALLSDVAGPTEDEVRSPSPDIVSASCQTDDLLVSLAASISKSFRHRAINTDPVCNEEKETNTRPRGVNSTLSFLGTTSNGILGENGHSEDVDTVTMGLDEMLTTDLDSLDNLTRARMRRKLRERWNTVASEDGHGDEHGLSGAIGATEGNVGTSGGHTSHHYLMQHPASAGRNGLTEAIDHSHPSSVYSARRSSAVQQSYRPW